MAIRRIFQTGFELNSLTAEVMTQINGGSNMVISSTTAKTGTYSLRCQFNVAGQWSFTATPQMRYGFHLVAPQQAANCYVSTVRDASNNILGGIVINTSYTGVGLYVGGVLVGDWFPISISNFYHYGIDVKKDASSGWWNFYVDGTLAASTSGNTSATTIGNITLGPNGGSTWAGTGQGYFDDLTIDDTTGEAGPVPVPDVRWPFTSLDGDGTYSQFTPSITGTHYTLLDEIPPNTTDYVYATSAGLRESFQFTNYTLSAGASIGAIVPTAVARKESSVDVLLGLGTGLSGTFSVGAFQSLPTSYGLIKFERQTTNPFGNDWDQNDLNNAEVIMMSSGTYA